MPFTFALAVFLVIAPSKIEGPYTEGKLAVYVVRGPQVDSRSYITLHEGLKSGAVKVRERGSGEVNTLEVENGSDKFPFLHVGDVVRGGKQDHTIAADVVLPPRSMSVAIDAFCVERGRWAAQGVTALGFSANDAIVSGAALKRSIQRDQSQQEVWSAVAAAEVQVAAYTGVPSPRLSASGTYSAIVDNETLRANREDYVQTLLPQVLAHEDAIGVVVAIDGEVVGADVYGSRELFKKLVHKVLDSYVQEAILAGGSPGVAAPTIDKINRFLNEGGDEELLLCAGCAVRVLSRGTDSSASFRDRLSLGQEADEAHGPHHVAYGR